MQYIATIDGQEFYIEILDEHHVRLSDHQYTVDFQAISGQPVYTLIVDGKSYEAFVSSDNGGWQVILMGRSYRVTIEDEREKMLRMAGGGGVTKGAEFLLKAPMPGMVVDVAVKEGQQVEKGDVLVILESMKMQNELRAPHAGKVTRVRVKPGDSVEQRQTMLSVQ